MAGETDDAIRRAEQETFTQEPPKTLTGQIGYLVQQLGSAKAATSEIGVTADTVNRYRRGARKHPPKDIAGLPHEQVGGVGLLDQAVEEVGEQPAH